MYRLNSLHYADGNSDERRYITVYNMHVDAILLGNDIDLAGVAIPLHGIAQ